MENQMEKNMEEDMKRALYVLYGLNINYVKVQKDLEKG